MQTRRRRQNAAAMGNAVRRRDSPERFRDVGYGGYNQDYKERNTRYEDDYDDEFEVSGKHEDRDYGDDYDEGGYERTAGYEEDFEDDYPEEYGGRYSVKRRGYYDASKRNRQYRESTRPLSSRHGFGGLSGERVRHIESMGSSSSAGERGSKTSWRSSIYDKGSSSQRRPREEYMRFTDEVDYSSQSPSSRRSFQGGRSGKTGRPSPATRLRSGSRSDYDSIAGSDAGSSSSRSGISSAPGNGRRTSSSASNRRTRAKSSSSSTGRKSASSLRGSPGKRSHR